jgi:hypothetical protein
VQAILLLICLLLSLVFARKRYWLSCVADAFVGGGCRSSNVQQPLKSFSRAKASDLRKSLLEQRTVDLRI